MTHPKIILASTLIFLAGALAGGVVVRELGWGHYSEEKRGESCLKPSRPFGNSHWEDKRKDFLQHMSRRLELSEEQENRIDSILQESQDSMKMLLDEVSPAMKTVFDRTEKKIRSVLSPEQRSEFDELLEHHRDKDDYHKKRWKDRDWDKDKKRNYEDSQTEVQPGFQKEVR